jgi:O-antigen ligase
LSTLSQNISLQGEKVANLFPSTIQRKINWFVFFISFPAINFLSNSITFYIFLLLILDVGQFWRKSYPGKKILFTFLLIIIIATFLAPYARMERHPGFMHAFQFVFQNTYWVLVAGFFIYFRNRIDYLSMSKWLFYGLLLSTFGFYVLPFEFDFVVGNINLDISRNGYVFTTLVCMPICFIYLLTFKRWQQIAFILFFLIALLLTNGRSGAVVGFIELLLISALIFPNVYRFSRAMFFPIIILFIVVESGAIDGPMLVFAKQIEPISPRFASLIKGEGEGDLAKDKSWLIRKLMIDKGYEIVEYYPFFGIGPNNFKYYDGSLSSLKSYERLSYGTTEDFNQKSAHNTYIQVLSDTGVFGFVIIMLLLIIPLSDLFKKIFKYELSAQHLPQIGLLAGSIHFYAISALTGAIPWLIVGLAWGALYKNKNKT